MASQNPNLPVYSHGGAGTHNFPTVTGNTTNAGNPILITYTNPNLLTGAGSAPLFYVYCDGGTATVVIESNPGPLDTAGNPPSGDWVVGATLSMNASDNTAKQAVSINPAGPYYRTRITALSAIGPVRSKIASAPGMSISYPSTQAQQSEN